MVVAAKIDSQLAAARHYQRQGVPAVDRWVISLCNQGRIAADDFQEEGGGIRLQPQSFGKILVDWETHWIRQGQETALDEWVARCACHIRHGEPETDPVADDPA